MSEQGQRRVAEVVVLVAVRLPVVWVVVFLLVMALVLVEVMVVVVVITRLILCSRHRGKHFSYFVYSSTTLRKALLSLFYRCRTQLVHHPQL